MPVLLDPTGQGVKDQCWGQSLQILCHVLLFIEKRCNPFIYFLPVHLQDAQTLYPKRTCKRNFYRGPCCSTGSLGKAVPLSRSCSVTTQLTWLWTVFSTRLLSPSLHGLHDAHLKSSCLTFFLSSIFRVWPHAVSTHNFNLALQTWISLSSHVRCVVRLLYPCLVEREMRHRGI